MASILESKGKGSALDEGQIFARRILKPLGNRKVGIGQWPNDCLYREAELAHGAHSAVAVCNLVTA